jgi:hypothetical protein
MKTIRSLFKLFLVPLLFARAYLRKVSILQSEGMGYHHQLMSMMLILVTFFIPEGLFAGSSNNPTISISPTTISQTEGNSSTTAVTLTISASECPNKKDIKIDWSTSDDTASAGTDYQAANGTVTFEVPGWFSSCDEDQDITITINGDTVVEPDETFNVIISDGGTNSSQHYTWGNQTTAVTITDDDNTTNQPPVADAGSDQNAAEGASVTLDGSSSSDSDGNITNFNWSDGSQTWTGVQPTVSTTGWSLGDHIITLTVTDDDGATDDDNVTIHIVEATNPVEETPPVCIESLSYSNSGGSLSSCFNASGIFVGGSGCKQIIKLRNLSYVPITNTDINVSYGTSGNTCGIDGVDKTGSDCNVSTGISYFEPLGDFPVLQTHTVYIEGAGTSIADTEPDIYMNYTQNGIVKYGKVEKCAVEDAYAAEDMCIANKETTGMMCIDMGDFFSGGMGCRTEITLRNISDTDLTGVSTQLVTDSLFNGSMIDDCGIDDISGNCTDSNMMDFGFMSMGMFQGSSITYDPIPDFASGGEHSTFTKSMISMSFFNNSAYMGTYIKTDANGVPRLYSGKLKMCDEVGTNLQKFGTGLDAVDSFDINTYEIEKGLKTKIVNKLYTVDAVYIGEDPDNDPSTQNDPETYDGLMDMAVLFYLSDENCSINEPIMDENGERLRAEIQNGEISGTTPTFKLNNISKVRRFAMKYYDWEKHISENPSSCIIHSSTEGNIKGMPQCINSENKYKEEFGQEAYERCLVQNGQPCKSNHHGVGNAPYDHPYGCYECTMGTTAPICSTDNFAIRPAGFRVFSKNEYKRAGEDFNVTIKAMDEGNLSILQGNVDDVEGVIGYDENLSRLDISSSFYVPTDAETRQMNIDAYNIDDTNRSRVAYCPFAGNFTVNDGLFRDGEINATMQFSETGILTIVVSEINGSEFAHIDSDDTNDSTRLIAPATTINDINDINKTNILLFIPYQFTTQAEYNTTTQKEWVYISNEPKRANVEFTTPQMAAYIKYKITAQNKDGNIVQNYTKSCFPDTSEANAPRRNGLKLNSTFDLFLDASLEVQRGADISLYTESNDSQAIWTLNQTKTLNEGNDTIQEWIGPKYFEHGVGKATVYFNIDRTYNNPINPLIIRVRDANTSTSWIANSGATKIFNPETSDSVDHNITFLYARAKSSLYFYDNVTSSSIQTPIMVQVYCNQWPASSTNCPSVDIFNGSTNEAQWFLSTDHNMTSGDGNITLSATNGSIHPTRVSINDANNGIDNVITVSGNAPDIVNIDFDTTNPTDTNTWLIYNKDSDSIPSPFYKVRFIHSGGDWTGYGKTGHVVGDDINTKRIKRLEW